LKSCVRDWRNIESFLAERLMGVKKIIFDHRTLVGICIIFFLSVFLGSVANIGLIKRYLKGEFKQAFISRESFPGLVFISLPEAEELWFSRQAIFIDSRSREEYQLGHIPGAVSLPLVEAKREKIKFFENFPPGTALVIYCEGGDCQTSLNLGKILYQRGFKNIRIYSGGWTEWVNAGKPVEK